jgi:hypothetical protein
MSNLEQYNSLFPATSDASIKCAAFLFSAASGVSRCYGNDPQWTTGATDDFQRRGNDNRAGAEADRLHNLAAPNLPLPCIK